MSTGAAAQAASDPPAPGFAGDLVRYVATRFFWVVATQMCNVAMGWLVYAQTKSPLALGLVGLAAFLPKLLLALVAGIVADRMDRRRVLAACLALNAATATSMAIVATWAQAPMAVIYLLVAALGVSRSFAMPASQAMLPGLVPRQELGRAAGIVSSATKIATILGPSLGGVIYLWAPMVPFAVAAALSALAAVLSLSIRPRAMVAGRRPAGLSDAFEGVRFIARRPVILGAISLDLFSVLLGGVTALLPIIVSDLLGAGPAVLGLLRAMPAFGAMVVGLWLSWRPILRRAGPTLFSATAVFGLATIGLAFSHDLYLTAALLWLTGAADVISVVIRQTVVQADTPDEMRGRVSAVNMLFIGASNELGEFESGVTAALFGLVPAILIGGAGTLMVAVIWARLFPDLWRRDTLV